MESTPDPGGAAPVDPRVLFAAERTLLAWIRTALALMGFGFVIARFGLFLRATAEVRGAATAGHGGGGSLWLGTALILIGLTVNLLASGRHIQTVRNLKRQQPLVVREFSLGVVLSAFLAVLGLAAAVYLVTAP